MCTLSAAAGLVWVWPGAGQAPQVPDFSRPPCGYTIHSEIEVSVSTVVALLHYCNPPACRSVVSKLSQELACACGGSVDRL